MMQNVILWRKGRQMQIDECGRSDWENVDFKEEDNKVRFRIAAMLFEEEGF